MTDIDTSIDTVKLAITALGLVPDAWASADKVKAASARLTNTLHELETWRVMTIDERRLAVQDFILNEGLGPLVVELAPEKEPDPKGDVV